MQETTGVLKQNIISEHDFALLDRQLTQKPSAVPPSLHGIICFMNDKTPEYLKNLSEDEKSKEDRVKYLQEKKRITDRKMQQMQEKKRKKEKSQISRQKKFSEYIWLIMENRDWNE